MKKVVVKKCDNVNCKCPMKHMEGEVIHYYYDKKIVIITS